MLTGSADIDALLTRAPEIAEYPTEPLQLGDVHAFQLTAEMHNQAREAVLPSALHPTVPSCLSIGAWRVGESTFGAFNFVFVRVTCRSGVRARGFTTAAFSDSAAATAVLRECYGFPCEQTDINIRPTYSDTTVQVDGVMDLVGLDPEPMANDDVQYTGTLNLAVTPKGPRLLQVEADHQARQVDRLRASIANFSAERCGNPLLDPYHVVSASVAREDIVLPPIRFQCLVDELAFTGTEPI